MAKKCLILLVLAIVVVGGISSQNRNPLAYTSWEPRPRANPYGGVASSQILDFNEDTFVGSNVYGVVAAGKYTVSGNTVTFINTRGLSATGTLSGGRLIIGQTVFYQL
jgi:hypothetical protein